MARNTVHFGTGTLQSSASAHHTVDLIILRSEEFYFLFRAVKKQNRARNRGL